MKIAVALSGGVDSTAVAYQLKQEGHEVMGLTMRLCPDVSALPGTAKSASRSRPGLKEHGCTQCIAPCACVDGRQCARELGIRHEIIDLRDRFEQEVINPFIDAFVAGITPNPCALCNRAMKFGILLDRARDLGCDRLATGHYARLLPDQHGPVLARAADRAKDQTYFMALVPRARFQYALFPLGDKTKEAVQSRMSAKGLVSPEQETSTEICFLRERAYTDFIRDRHPEAFTPGPIVDQTGRVLGEHKGLPAYTIGQRKGLGVAAANPLYVLRLDPKTNRLVVGDDEALRTRSVDVDGVNWMTAPPAQPMAVKALIRYRQQPVAALLSATASGGFSLTFDQPVRAVTPGQVAAAYAGDKLLAGGLIRSPRLHAEEI